MKCNGGPRPNSRALCLHAVYIYPGHNAPVPTLRYPHTHTHPEKLPHKTATTRTTTKPQHKYYCRNFYKFNSTGTCNTSSAEPLVCLWALPKKYPSQVTNCPLLRACPSDPYFPFLSSPRLARSTLMKLSSWEIKWLERPALLVSSCVESTHTSGGGTLPALALPRCLPSFVQLEVAYRSKSQGGSMRFKWAD